MKTYYVYTHSIKDGDYFYVGMSTKDRGGHEYYRAFNFDKKERNALWLEYFEKNCSKGVCISIEFEGDLSECLQFEKDLIARYGRICKGNGTLTNIGVGGEITTTKSTLVQYDLDGNFMKVWDSVDDVMREYGCSKESILNAAAPSKSVQSSSGYMWRYFGYTGDYSNPYYDKIAPYKKKFRVGAKHIGYDVFVFNDRGVFLSHFPSILSCSKNLDIDTSSIIKCLQGKRLMAGGFYFSKQRKLQLNDFRCIEQYTIDGLLVRRYKTIAEASRHMGGVSATSIKNQLSGKQKTAYGHKWKTAKVSIKDYEVGWMDNTDAIPKPTMGAG